MSGSSGVRVTSRIVDRECENAEVCDWAGEVDEWMDPETMSAAWECPECEHQHESSLWDEYDDRDEDA